jgi:O-antigen ligase
MIWLLIGYMFLFIHRPFEVWPALGVFHLERLYMLAVLLLAVFWPGKRWLPNKLHFAYAGMGLAVFACWLASPWASYDKAEQVVWEYFKVFIFYVLLVLFVHSERDLRRVLVGLLVVMTLYLGHSLREYVAGRHVYRMGIERMVGVDTSMGDPNSFGATIVYVLPFVAPFWLDPRSRHWRWVLVAYLGLSVACIGLTGSRSAFVSLLLAVLLTVVKSRYRTRMVVLALVAAPLFWAALPESLQKRFETIVNPEVGPANAQTSAEGRIEGFYTGIRLWNESPFTGCGPGAWIPASGGTIESHNLYGQVTGELGGLGAVAFVAMLVGLWMNLRWFKKTYRQHPEWGEDFLSNVARGVGLAVILLLFEGNFSHNLYRYMWLWYGGMLIIARYCVERRLAAEAWAAWHATQEVPHDEDCEDYAAPAAVVQG